MREVQGPEIRQASLPIEELLFPENLYFVKAAYCASRFQKAGRGYFQRVIVLVSALLRDPFSRMGKFPRAAASSKQVTDRDYMKKIKCEMGWKT